MLTHSDASFHAPLKNISAQILLMTCETLFKVCIFPQILHIFHPFYIGRPNVRTLSPVWV